MTVLELPPKAFIKSLVRTEFLNGTIKIKIFKIFKIGIKYKTGINFIKLDNLKKTKDHFGSFFVITKYHLKL